MKKIELPSGRYVVAVSGGVDSVVLLDNLAQQKDLQLVVAHFDHGIRVDSADDNKFVEDLAKKHNLPFESAKGRLGPKASEARAREARYNFLRTVQEKHQADAIVTAHHQDDLLETIVLNLLRGTGRKGLTSLADTSNIKRPLLKYRKAQLLDYAKTHNLKWREDSTNVDTSYLRNWVRLTLLPKISVEDRQKLLDLQASLKDKNKEIDTLLNGFSRSDTISRQDVIALPHNVSKELIANWLRANNIRSFDQKVIERITVGAKTLQAAKIIPVTGGYYVEVGAKTLSLHLHK